MHAISAIFYLIIYFVFTGALYRLFKKAGIKHPWFAFIPILSTIGQLWAIGKSGWNAFWLLAPILNIIIPIIWLVAFLQTFGKSGWWVLLACIPFLDIIFAIMFLIWGYGSKTQYLGIPAWVKKWKPLSQASQLDSSDFTDWPNNNL